MSTITEKTLMPIGILASVLSVAVGGAWWMSSLYSRVSYAESSINALQESNKEVVKQLQSVNETLIQIRTTLDNPQSH